MTNNDKVRTKCIEIGSNALEENMKDLVDPSMNTFAYGGNRQHWIDAFTAAFDAIAAAGVRVVPVEATEEMIETGCSTGQYDNDATEIWRLMSAAGDLTNAPEKKIWT